MRAHASPCCARELASERLLASPFASYSAETLSELAIVRAAARAHELYGPASITTYIVSKCDSVSDLLEVNILLKETGLYRGQGLARASIMAVPLFETIADLETVLKMHNRLVVAAGSPSADHRAAWLPGSDGGLFGLQQGRRLSDLRLEPA